MALVVNDTLLAGDRAVQELAGVDLDTGFVGIDLQVDAGLRAVQFRRDFRDVAGGVQDPVVVVAVSVADLLVVCRDLVADGIYFSG